MTRPYLSVRAILVHFLFILQLVSSQVISFDEGDLLLGARDNAATIVVLENEIKGVVRAAQDRALDFGRVLGTNGTLVQGDTVRNSNQQVVVIVGTIGNSTVIDKLVDKGKINISKVQGKWESYIQAVVDDPLPGISHAFVIAGSDKRGTIYGIYDISEAIGVSPWYWWADVPLLLRLKANYLWPGMKRKEAFYLDDEDDGRIAHEYGIFMGTSHHEPMAKTYYEQQYRFEGPWDWSENYGNVVEFMRDGVNRTKDWDTLYTLGMRGDGDQESPALTSSQLEEIIQTQQDMIEELTGKELKDVPQTWSLYKEVGRYWQAGMNVSDLVTLMWADDNFGNLLRVPWANETDRPGGAGVYYHFGYVGDPRNYEWISTVQLVKTWEQMHLAYEKGAREIWIANSQDIKPYEIPTNHFLDMAYDMSKFQNPESTTEWLKAWAKREFGSGIESATAEILNIYGRLVVRRKYETLSMMPFAYHVLNYDEAENVLQEWEDLLDQARRVHDSLDQPTRDAFYELVLHQVLAGKYVQEIYIATHLGWLYKNQKRASTNRLAAQARTAFANDAATC
ncbi:hypothetical protein P170DRAFT_467185 [Aspergillus steynii IBT 23096]|uniref:Alpha glucuronidase N-terminal domain-containing protein n=1 Tax=Aspergillus steynii IBT 23096 TaxID=1392250 RepID=A0A2I2FZF8_9EURO|nr:uncharacterized protein P170DRAFT_467185 [Aspergillus steynii IBT 23096]PLB46014.1 hypothetical protein P170DRAFT_467185 [Aspergillus steynii IBT 23096]